MAQRFVRFLCVAIVATGVYANGTKAQEDQDKYGIAHSTISEQELAEDQKYGGYPNNKFFNNDTKCRAVNALFATPGMNSEHPKMLAFKSYTRVKLMELDIGNHIIKHLPPVVDLTTKEQWRLLPALFPTFCKNNPNVPLDHATGKVLDAARIAFAPQ